MSPCLYHLIAATQDLSEVLAARTAAGWLLPSFFKNPCGELPAQVHEQLDHIAATVDLVHEAPLPSEGCAQGDESYFAATVSGLTRSQQVVPLAVDELLSTSPLIPLQRQALVTALTRLRDPAAPFDSAAQVAAAMDWARRQISAHVIGGRVVSITPHRCMRYDYVVRLGTTVGNLYFKGGLERIADEASLTDALATLTSGQVPSTITTDYASGRWLYHELAGDLLIGSAFTEQMATAAVRALASLQKRALTGSAVEEHLSRRRMCALDLFARVNETIEESAETPDGDAERLDQWRRESARIAGTCARIDALGHPLTLVLSDFCGRNLLLTTGGIGFIDLEQSYWSHPWLSLWHFLHDVEQSGVMRNGARHRIARAFVSEWADIVPAGTMIQALTHLPTLGRLFGILLATRELAIQERELGEKLPARYRIKRLAPYIDRLLGCPTNLRSG